MHALAVTIVASNVPRLGGPGPENENEWYSVFALDGISFSVFPGTLVNAAPGLNVTSFGVIVNQNTRCSLPIFLDGSAHGGATFLPIATSVGPRIDPVFLSSMIISFDAGGVPSATDTNGLPFAVVPFPSTAGSNDCAPATIGADARISLGAGTAVASAFFPDFYFLSVA